MVSEVRLGIDMACRADHQASLLIRPGFTAIPLDRGYIAWKWKKVRGRQVEGVNS